MILSPVWVFTSSTVGTFMLCIASMEIGSGLESKIGTDSRSLDGIKLQNVNRDRMTAGVPDTHEGCMYGRLPSHRRRKFDPTRTFGKLEGYTVS